MFKKILIANRGEIACRIIRTCRHMGILTVAVYSDADRLAQHVIQADEAFHIGGPRPVDSYLKGDVIIEVARRSGAEAIHPGYGFLSENEAFAAACENAGIAFIGPTPEAATLPSIRPMCRGTSRSCSKRCWRCATTSEPRARAVMIPATPVLCCRDIARPG